LLLLTFCDLQIGYAVCCILEISEVAQDSDVDESYLKVIMYVCMSNCLAYN